MAGATSAQRGRDVRRRLLDAAAVLIAERGWAAVSTRMVADKAGVTPGLVHYHFASLNALLVEAATRTFDRLADELVGLLDDAESAEDAVMSMARATERYPTGDPAFLLVSEAYLAGGRDPDLRARIAAMLTRVRGHLAGVLDRSGVDRPAESAAVLIAALDGTLLHRALTADAETSADVVAPILTRILTRDEMGDE